MTESDHPEVMEAIQRLQDEERETHKRLDDTLSETQGRFTDQLASLQAGRIRIDQALAMSKWVVGLLLGSLLTLAAWSIVTTLTSEERLEDTRGDLVDHAAIEGHPGMVKRMGGIRSDVRALTTAVEAESRAARTDRREIKRRLIRIEDGQRPERRR